MENQKKTVLITDDEEDLTWSISRSLKRDNSRLSILSTNSGDEALRFLQKRSIDLLITDLRMPGIDGYSLINYIIENSLLTKIIVMTAYGSTEIKEEISKIGCDFYIEKPFEISTLKRKVYSILGEDMNSEPPGGGMNHQIRKMLLSTQKTPNLLLTIFRNGFEGKLYSSYGRIYRAVLGKKRGEEALNEIMSWENGFIKAQTGIKGKIRSMDS